MSDTIELASTTRDHHHPRYHPRPPLGYLNDPNGPIVLDDTLHLYFQSRPTADLAVPVEWGHLTSSDFVTWRLHRPAMAPVPDGPDRDGCYSGNTVLDDGRIRAFYSGRRTDSPYESILTAVSNDGGYTFGAPSQVVPDPTPDEDCTMFRDPFVWKTDDGWRMVVGSGYADGRSAARLYQSPDLQDWQRLDDLASLPMQNGDGPDVGEAWECPQVLNLDGTSVAVVGTWTQAKGVNSVLSLVVGEPTRLSVVDHGTNFYAASGVAGQPIRSDPVRLDHRRAIPQPVARSGMGRSTVTTTPGVARKRQHRTVSTSTGRSATASRRGRTRARDRGRRTVRDRCTVSNRPDKASLRPSRAPRCQLQHRDQQRDRRPVTRWRRRRLTRWRRDHRHRCRCV